MKKVILIHPNPILRQRSLPVENVNTLTLCKDLIQTMHYHRGCGLSAPQIGVLKRVFVTNDSNYPVFINPIIIEGYGAAIENEGCLSVPGIMCPAKRYVRVRVKALDFYGKAFYIDTRGILAKIIQHEIDHLNGRLIIDY
jgi:peptide deformylase